MPSITPTQLSDAGRDAVTIADIANSPALTTTDRLGRVRRTLQGVLQWVQDQASVVLGGLGYLPPVAYSSGIAINNTRQTVTYQSVTYAGNADAIPFTTSGTFETAKFRVVQGITSADAGASTGAGLFGWIRAEAGAIAGTVLTALRLNPAYPEYFGAKAQAGFDSSDAFDAWCSAGRDSGAYLRLPKGDYWISRPIPFAVNGVAPAALHGHGIDSRINRLPGFAGDRMLDARQVAGRSLRDFTVDVKAGTCIGVDTSWTTSGPSVHNDYYNVVVQNHGATAWKGHNDNDSNYSRVLARQATVDGLYGVDVTASGGAVSLDNVICANSKLSITAQNGNVTNGYARGLICSTNGAKGTNHFGIDGYQLYCGPVAISTDDPSVAGNAINGLRFRDGYILGKSDASGDNSSFILNCGLNGMVEFDNTNFVPPTATSGVPSPLFRLFGPAFKDQAAIGKSVVRIRGGKLNSLDLVCYSGGSPIVIVEDSERAGVGLANDQQGYVTFRSVITLGGGVVAGQWYDIIPEAQLAAFDLLTLGVVHKLNVAPFHVTAVLNITATPGLANGAILPLAAVNTGNYLLEASALAFRQVAPGTAGNTPRIQFSPNYTVGGVSTVQIICTRQGNATLPF